MENCDIPLTLNLNDYKDIQLVTGPTGSGKSNSWVAFHNMICPPEERLEYTMTLVSVDDVND